MNVFLFSERFYSNENVKLANYATVGKVIVDQVMGDNSKIFKNEISQNRNFGIVDHLLKLYKISTECDNDIQKLPDLDAYTNEQLLYLITAQSYCEIDRNGKRSLF